SAGSSASAASRRLSGTAASGHLPARARSCGALTPTSWAMRATSSAPQRSSCATLARAVFQLRHQRAAAVRALVIVASCNKIDSAVESAKSDAVAQYDPARARQLDRGGVLQLRQGAGYGLDGETEVIRDVLTRHRQLDRVIDRHPLRHFQEKADDPLARGLDE